MASIGFIGLGHMGGPMAANLLRAGHSLKVFDLVDTAVQKAVDLGATAAADAAEAARDVDVLISMLPSSPHSEALYLHDARVLEVVGTGTLVIDSSTIAPETARRIAAAARERGVRMIDAPVSGGVAGAEAGTLTFIVGGAAQDVEAAREVLSCMGKNIFHAGDSGAGQVAKICNNMLLAVHMIGTCEALNLGVANGLDPAVLSEIMLKSSGRNWSLEVYNPWPGVMEGVPASREYDGGFMVDLMAKDLGLAMEAALHARTSAPMGALARSLYALHSGQGNGALDFSSIQRMISGTDD